MTILGLLGRRDRTETQSWMGEEGTGSQVEGTGLSGQVVTLSLPLFPYSPERPHLSLWLEAPDLLLAEVDLPKLVSASFLVREKN